MPIIKATEFDVSKITFSSPKSSVRNRNLVFANYNRGKIIIQTPKMYAGSGIKRWPGDTDTNPDQFEIDLSFERSSDESQLAAQVADFRARMEAFDNAIKDAYIVQADAWASNTGIVTKKLTRQLLDDDEDKYRPIVKIPRDKAGELLPYPKRMKIKIDRELGLDGKATTRFLCDKSKKLDVLFFDETKARMQVDATNAEMMVPKGSQVVCAIELVYISISKDRGVSTKWKLVQAKVFDSKEVIDSYALIDEDDEDDEDTNAAPPTLLPIDYVVNLDCDDDDLDI